MPTKPTRIRAYRSDLSAAAPFVLFTNTGAMYNSAAQGVVLKMIRCGVDPLQKPFVEGELSHLEVKYMGGLPVRMKQEDGLWKLGFKRALYNHATERFYWSADVETTKPVPLFVADVGVLCPTGLYVML